MSLDNKQPGSFFDKNTFFAIALSFAVFFLWQTYVSKKYPPKNSVETTQVNSPANNDENSGVPVAGNSNSVTEAKIAPSKNGVAVPATGQALLANAKEEVLKYESDELEFDISSYGMGIKNLRLKKFLDRKGEAIFYAAGEGTPLIYTVVNGLKNYTISKISENVYRGVSTDENLTVVKTLTIDPQKYLIKAVVETKAIENQKIVMDTFVTEKVLPVSKSFLLPSYEHQEFFTIDADKEHRTVLSPETAVKEGYQNVKLASFNSHYFALLLANRTEDIFPSVSSSVEHAQGSIDFKYETSQPVDMKEFKFDFYVGPKDMTILKSIDDEFKNVIDYGFFSFIGRPLLWILRFLQGIVGNWGVAIILLTLILRLCLMPMNLYSFRAMRKMQKVQPKLKEIKEKYKNDPAKVNQETMLLMKAEKANPLSGCIPALMQIPIFFALYSVLGKSIELYKQPFFLWIHDLSLKDPFFIFPVLVGLTFFVQQKITPSTTMDPTQQKVLMFMPLIFIVFMLNTPSGLTLYMFVNGLFGVFQQYMFTKEKQPV
jgi:YidC/Oxa1 family membrane protein insertase